MQVSTFCSRLELVSKLIDWYWDSTCVPFNGLLIFDMSPRTDDQLRCFANTGSYPSKFYILDRLKKSKVLDAEHTKSLYSTSVPFSHKWKNLFLQSCPKEFIRFLCDCMINPLYGDLQSVNRHHASKFRYEVWLLSLSKIFHFEAMKRRPDIWETSQLKKVLTPPITNHLSWFAALCPRPCFCIQKQEFENSDSHQAGASKIPRRTKSLVPNWLADKAIKQKTVRQSRFFCRPNFVLSSYQALIFAELIFGYCRKYSFTVRLRSTT